MGLLGSSRGFLVGFTVGFGSGLILHDYLPKLKDTTQPFLKLAFKSTLLVAEKSRELSTLFVENIQDLLAEVRAELKEQRARPVESTQKVKVKKKKSTGVHAAAEDTNVVPLRERKLTS